MLSIQQSPHKWNGISQQIKIKIATITISLGMEINGSKEVDFNFDTKETSSLDDSGLDAPMGRHESRPRHTSQMAPNALDTSTSNVTLSPNEGSLALKSSSKECDIVATILNDDHPLPKSMEQRPSSSTCQGGVPDKKK